jgi:glycosidase
MNYPLKEAIIAYMQSGNAANLLQTVRVLINHYPKQTVDCLMNILGTHDTARILTVLGGVYCHNKDEMASSKAIMDEKTKQNAVKKLKMAAVLQYTLPGVPCVYYGDENGMQGHIDPFCRRCFNWNDLNEDLIGFYAKLGKIRKDNREIFKDGEFHELAIEDGLLVYARENEQGNIFVFVNNSSKRYYLNLPEKSRELLSNIIYQNQIEVKPYSYGILKTEK